MDAAASPRDLVKFNVRSKRLSHLRVREAISRNVAVEAATGDMYGALAALARLKIGIQAQYDRAGASASCRRASTS